MAPKVKKESSPLSTGKKRTFTLIALSIPVLVFCLLEIGLRIGNYGGDLSLFRKSTGFGTADIYVPNPNFASRYFVNIRVVPTPSRDAFLAEKPKNGLRLFVLGESTTAGYPYSANGMFSRVVRDALSDVLPADSVEVVNVAMSAINSYTVFDQIDEILEHKPDGILIYLGHNEFYGALGVASAESLGAFPGFVRFYLKLQQLRTFRLLRDIMGRAMSIFRTEQTGTLMERVVREQTIPLHSSLYTMGMNQFRSNLSAIIQKLTQAGIPVYVSSVASNVRHQSPFISVKSDTLPEATFVYEEAQQLLHKGDTTAARTAFAYARDLDGLRFRASSEVNTIIKEIAGQPGVHYVPVAEAFEAASPGGIIGNELMLEHLHPNQDGYHLMGKTFYETIASSGFLGRNADPERLLSWERYYEQMFLTDFDQRAVWHRLQILMQGWPFVEKQTTDYRSAYRYQGKVDSAAYEYVNGDLTWDRAKVELAEWYTAQADTDRALLEYFGLIRDQLLNDSPRLFAARIFLDRGDYHNALPLLESAHALLPSAYSMKMLGALEIDRGNLDRGIELLNGSLALKSDDPQTLFNLSGAWAMKGDLVKAREFAQKTADINPRFPGLPQWLQQIGVNP